ncbi:hypothetical protein [Mesorhizobium sp.]|uniref:hypothetical protein n=1 Tax=Mesorhizobium sp. TaxID=1871066 RepID=UPI000FE6E89D|nr:hypothetical protein [Mesorhizobium sp.]RWK55977.1 MAG: hypothetical protein EOR49_35245 [Mesorhizobium sp.]
MRTRDKRDKHVAAVATTRKLAVIVWHMPTKDEDYIWDRSALLDLEASKAGPTAGYPSHRGGRAEEPAADYSNKSVRDSECETIGNAEEAYRRFVVTWKQQSPKGHSGAAHEMR